MTKTRKYRKKQKGGDLDTCSICLNSIEPKHIVLGHVINENSQHLFHKKCLHEHFRRNGNKCPNCRVMLINSNGADDSAPSSPTSSVSSSPASSVSSSSASSISSSSSTTSQSSRSSRRSRRNSPRAWSQQEQDNLVQKERRRVISDYYQNRSRQIYEDWNNPNLYENREWPNRRGILEHTKNNYRRIPERVIIKYIIDSYANNRYMPPDSMWEILNHFYISQSVSRII